MPGCCPADPSASLAAAATAWRWQTFDGPDARVKVQAIEDESKCQCPRPWLLMATNMGLSMLYAMTVCGALFFMMAAPTRATPKCWNYEWLASRVACSATALVCWTYPLVCTVFVGFIYAKNMLDARMFYELLLTRIPIDYESKKFWHSRTVLGLLFCGLIAFSNFAFMAATSPSGLSVRTMLDAYSHALAYLTPVMSFLILLISNWSIDGLLMPLPRYYTADYKWAVELLSTAVPMTLRQLELGYTAAEKELSKAGAVVTTSEMIALIAHHAPPKGSDRPKHCSGGGGGGILGSAEAGLLVAKSTSKGFMWSAVRTQPTETQGIYWVARWLYFNSQIKDARSAEYRRWARVYMAYLALLVCICTVVLFCTAMSCLDLLHVVDLQRHPHWRWLQLAAAKAEMAEMKSALVETVTGVTTAGRMLRSKLGLIQVSGDLTRLHGHLSPAVF
eukprot:TRINITY_DN90979_c0_g1_i1.p1 TRINITY_DN90979_c0_g1~~TRINITY_DN90979_c0_g1_i1.p1  ORF type:complete len:448 (-),score=69.85 TRINITY_DN90979_c0_g1_i1:64-1407(-)